MNQLEDLLFSRWKEKKLAHFYILRAGLMDSNPEETLQHFISTLLKKILFTDLQKTQLPENNFINLCPDILILQTDKNSYIQEDFNDFFQFLTLSNYQLSWRFIIVNHAQKIRDQLLNKLLKSLEEPPKETSIFFLIPGQYKLLPTIESRAIKLNIDKNSEHQKHYCQSELPELIAPYVHDFIEGITSPTQMAEVLSQKKEIILPTLTYLIQKKLEDSETDFEQLNKILLELQWFQTSAIFSNNLQERIFGILCAVSKSKSKS